MVYVQASNISIEYFLLLGQFFNHQATDMNRFVFSSLFSLLWMIAFAQSPARSGNDHAVFFYVTDYQPGWGDLTETEAEVDALATELKNNYGFSTEVVVNPTKKQIEDKITEVNSLKLGAKDQLLLFFSMHGYFDKDAQRGYLVPADGKYPHDDANAWKSWFSYDDLNAYISKNKCGHVLLALDACYSGAFGTLWKGMPTKLPWEHTYGNYLDCRQKIDNVLAYHSRHFFTSGSQLQRTPARSLFASMWLEALRHGNETGLVRISDLQYYLGRIEFPKPESGTFSNHHEEGGDFAFVHKTACGGPFDNDNPEDKAAWEQANNANTLEAYNKYLTDYPNGEFHNLARASTLSLMEAEFDAWEEAKAANTAIAYDNFVLKFPNSKYKELAVHNRSQLFTQKSVSAPSKLPAPPSDLPDFVFVQGATFVMGSNDGDKDEKPTHKVSVSDFYLARHELTVDEFSKFILATDYQTDADKKGGSYFEENAAADWKLKTGINWKYDATGKLRPPYEYYHPVIHVSWNDAVAYCNWRSEQDGLQRVYAISGPNVTADWSANGYRLPTEAEWEFAARSRGKGEKWAGTSSEGSLASFANYHEGGTKDGHLFTAPVGSSKANAIGIHDMSGNVWEWCWDKYGEYPDAFQTNPRGHGTGAERVYRGGSWNGYPSFLRCVNRGSYSRGNRNTITGFRLARTVN